MFPNPFLLAVLLSHSCRRSSPGHSVFHKFSQKNLTLLCNTCFDGVWKTTWFGSLSLRSLVRYVLWANLSLAFLARFELWAKALWANLSLAFLARFELWARALWANLSLERALSSEIGSQDPCSARNAVPAFQHFMLLWIVIMGFFHVILYNINISYNLIVINNTLISTLAIVWHGK